ncbi:MAG TPA: RDD family protein [Solimonas sp.]|nr:RDD family protein [Solimonas sp.]
MDDETPTSSQTLRVAGAPRRMLAFVLDVLLLGVLGSVLGGVFADFFTSLGAWGRLLGFAIAAVYFALLDSRVALGGSIGKLVLGLRVVGRDGRALSPLRALLRFVPVGIPYFLHDAHLPLAALRMPWRALDAAAVSGLALAGLYLLVFNRASRQALHDLLCACRVVHRAGTPERRPWRGHYAVCALIVLFAALAPLRPSLPDGFLAHIRTPAPTIEMQAALRSQPWVEYASVRRSAALRYFGADVLAMSVRVVDRNLGAPERFEQAARTALLFTDDADALDMISVTLSYGYDIGIADRAVSRSQSHSVAEWRALIGPSAYAI